MTMPLTELRADVVIAGGGIMGCSAALELARKGVDVVLLEARLCGSQASGVNFGGVRRQGRHVEELPLAQRAHAIWQKLQAVIGDACEYEPIGHLRLAHTETHLAALVEYQAKAREYGLDLEVFDNAELRRRYPWLTPTLAGGSLAREDGHANPRLVAPYFAAAAREHGVCVLEHTPVTSVEFDGTQFTVLAEGMRVRARQFVNTAGAWGLRIARQLGDDAPLTTIYPNMLVTEPLPAFMTHALGVVGGGFYARQVGRGNVVIGGRRAMRNTGLDTSRPDAVVTLETLHAAARCVPCLAKATIIRTWTGIEGYFADTLPVLGPSATTPGAWHAFGFSGHGFQLGPAVGEVLAELVLNGHTTTPIEPFSISRFATAVS